MLYINTNQYKEPTMNIRLRVIFNSFHLKLLVFLAATTIFSLLPKVGNSQDKQDQIVNWWTFNEDHGKFVLDKASQKKDSLYGNHEYVPGISGNAIKLDGFRTYIRRNAARLNSLTGSFTVESWIALASYPWSWSPIVDCSYPKIKGFFFGIDQEGRTGFNIATGSSWFEVVSEEKISLGEWNHVAAVFESNKKVTLYINGKEVAAANIQGNFIPSRRGTLTIGRNNVAQTWNEFQLTTKNQK